MCNACMYAHLQPLYCRPQLRCSEGGTGSGRQRRKTRTTRGCTSHMARCCQATLSRQPEGRLRSRLHPAQSSCMHLWTSERAEHRPLPGGRTSQSRSQQVVDERTGIAVHSTKITRNLLRLAGVVSWRQYAYHRQYPARKRRRASAAHTGNGRARRRVRRRPIRVAQARWRGCGREIRRCAKQAWLDETQGTARVSARVLRCNVRAEHRGLLEYPCGLALYMGHKRFTHPVRACTSN